MKYVASAFAAFMVNFLAWVAGFDFDQRGGTAFIVAFYTMLISGFVFWLFNEIEKTNEGVDKR